MLAANKAINMISAFAKAHPRAIIGATLGAAAGGYIGKQYDHRFAGAAAGSIIGGLLGYNRGGGAPSKMKMPRSGPLPTGPHPNDAYGYTNLTNLMNKFGDARKRAYGSIEAAGQKIRNRM